MTAPMANRSMDITACLTDCKLSRGDGSCRPSTALLRWSRKFGQDAKLLPTRRTDGNEDDKEAVFG